MSIWKHHNKNQCITFKKSPLGMQFQVIPYLPNTSVAWELKNIKSDFHLPIHHLLQNAALHFLCACAILDIFIYLFIYLVFHHFTSKQSKCNSDDSSFFFCSCSQLKTISSCLFITEIFAFTPLVSPMQFLFERVCNYTTLYWMGTEPSTETLLLCKLFIHLLQR